MSLLHLEARNLATALLDGEWLKTDLLERVAISWGRKQRWQRGLINRILAAFRDKPKTRARKELIAFIESDDGFRSGLRRQSLGPPRNLRIRWITPVMAPVASAASWNVPAIITTTALAEWLGLTCDELNWFADCLGQEARVKSSKLRHYTYRWLPKRGGKWRLLEVPKSRLKAIQRKILREILNRIPVHIAAHGYCAGRSIVSFAAPHCGKSIVLRFDLRHFFPSVPGSRVHALFTTTGYPTEVARLLTGLCTNVVPDHVWALNPAATQSPVSSKDRERYRSPHLPQGAPTSPALANLCARRLDIRLHALAQTAGAIYTRYADDLAFSGGLDLEQSLRRFRMLVCQIAVEEGFAINLHKSRFMGQGVRQELTGIVVNAHTNTRRADFDLLKAILTNCARNGPESQNRDGRADFRGHLLGRIAHVGLVNAGRGKKLRELFERIVWKAESP